MLSDLIHRFGHIDEVAFHADEKGYVMLTLDNAFAHAKIALQGAHLFHFQPRNRPPLLWLSETARFERSKAIRGGIPVCWPWFGAHPEDDSLPNHGFARTSIWHVEAISAHDDGSTTILLELRDDEATRRLWPHRFSLQLAVTVADTLTVSLTTKNLDTVPFTVSAALHTYFAISDIEKVKINGLERCRYFDQLDGGTKEQKDAVTVEEETDRIYLDTPKQLELHDQGRTVVIAQEGSKSCIVWNPWIEKTKRFDDMPDEAYRSMLCIETANVLDDARTLLPGEEHLLGATYHTVIR